MHRYCSRGLARAAAICVIVRKGKAQTFFTQLSLRPMSEERGDHLLDFGAVEHAMRYDAEDAARGARRGVAEPTMSLDEEHAAGVGASSASPPLERNIRKEPNKSATEPPPKERSASEKRRIAKRIAELSASIEANRKQRASESERRAPLVWQWECPLP